MPGTRVGMVVGPVQILQDLFIIDLLSVLAFDANREFRRIAQ